MQMQVFIHLETLWYKNMTDFWLMMLSKYSFLIINKCHPCFTKFIDRWPFKSRGVHIMAEHRSDL